MALGMVRMRPRSWPAKGSTGSTGAASPVTASSYGDPPMPTLFTRIIDGDLPGRFVHRDDTCVAFLSIAPLRPGHTLVVPIEEIDHWIDAPAELNAHLLAVAQRIGQAQQQVFSPTKTALVIAGL